MESWNINGPYIFNDSTINNSVAHREFDRKRLTARASETRRQLTARRYWHLELSGLTINREQLQEIRDFEAVTHQGMESCLIRISSYDMLERELCNGGREAAFLGTGNGTPQTFQLKRRSTYQGKPIEDIIQYPWFDYPPLQDLNLEDWAPMLPLQIWQGAPVWNQTLWQLENKWVGNEITSQCEINRLGGQVLSSANGALYATGGFLWRMLCPTGIKVKPDGPAFVVQDGIEFIEPFPDAGEVEG